MLGLNNADDLNAEINSVSLTVDKGRRFIPKQLITVVQLQPNCQVTELAYWYLWEVVDTLFKQQLTEHILKTWLSYLHGDSFYYGRL